MDSNNEAAGSSAELTPTCMAIGAEPFRRVGVEQTPRFPRIACGYDGVSGACVRGWFAAVNESSASSTPMTTRY
jgi:hypothetical protein